MFDVAPEKIKIGDTGITLDKTGVDLMKPDATNIQTFDDELSLLAKGKDKVSQFIEKVCKELEMLLLIPEN